MNHAENLIIEDEILSASWLEQAKDAFDSKGNPLYIDSEGQLIEGIYLGMPNDLYHKIKATSSSMVKKFIESPALYYREYLSDISRKRTISLNRTFDAGTYGHELCLEADGFYDRYFRDLKPSDCPDALSTITEIETELIKKGLPAKESKDDKIERLLLVKPSVNKDTLANLTMIDAMLVEAGESKTENKYHKGLRLIKADPKAQVFDVLFQENRNKEGQKEIVEGEEGCELLYGGKKAIDPVVWDDAHRVQKTVMAHSEARRTLENGLPEVTILSLCPLTDMWLKVKFDWLRFDCDAADVKTTQSTKPEKFIRQIRDLHYNIQQVFYQYVASLQDVYVKRFSFIAVEYINADICQPYELRGTKVTKSHIEMMKALSELNECAAGGHWYGWSKQDVTMVI